MNAKIDPTRLYSQLNTTGIAVKDPTMYQFLRELIRDLLLIAEAIGSSGSGGAGINTTVITNILNQMLDSAGDGNSSSMDDSILIPGPQGIQGVQGIPGTTGAAGSSGSMDFSDIGNEDSISIPGPVGQTGAQGTPGTPGALTLINFNDNDGNEDNILIPGPSGQKGDKGDVGINGIDGQDGIDGISVQGIQGIKGDQGIPGADGIDPEEPFAIPGPQGLPGIAGIQGLQGIPGMDGIDADELRMIPGPPGIQGIQGPVGIPGLDGDAYNEVSLVSGPQIIPPDGNGIRDLNVITNGGFAVQQRVATASTAIPNVNVTARLGQVADRWAVTAGNVVTTQWAQIDTAAAVETGLNSRYYGKITQITNAAKFILSQYIVNQDMAHLRGQTVRLSVKIKQFVGAAATYRLGLLQLTAAGTVDGNTTFTTAIGAAGVDPTWSVNLSPIAPEAANPENGTITAAALNITSTAGWVRSSAVFVIPSNAKNLIPVLYRDTLGAANDALGIAEFQLTQRSDIVDWVSLPFVVELERCLRFFAKTFTYLTVPVTNAGTDTGEAKGIAGKAGAVANAGIIIWRPPMRMFKTGANITATAFNPVAANALMCNVFLGTSMGVTGVLTVDSDNSIYMTATGVASTVIGALIGVHLTADCEYT